MRKLRKQPVIVGSRYVCIYLEDDVTKTVSYLGADRELHPSIEEDIPDALGLIRMLVHAAIQSDELGCEECSLSLYAAIEGIKTKFHISEDDLYTFARKRMT